jgi:hypothetical protein
MQMMWSYRYLRGRLNRKVSEFALAELQEQNKDLFLGESQGARWRRLPDGSWQRWSYLGNDWEAATAPDTLLHAAEAKLAVNEWTAGPEGSWHPYEPARSENAEPNVETRPVAAEETHPASAPKSDPDAVPRPQWTSDWNPTWNTDVR